MKGEYPDERDSTINSSNPATANMFSKFQQPKFQTHPHQQFHHHPHHQHLFHLSAKDPQTSEEEADSSAAAAAAAANNNNNPIQTPTPTQTPTATKRPPKKPKTSTTNSDGETIEVVNRRPRGRPPGSKNRPKPPPVVIASEPDNPGMSPYILEVPSGADIIDSLARVARRRCTGLCVLTASGFVADVSLRQPVGGTLTFHGRFEMLSLSAVLLSVAVGNFSMNGIFTISLAGNQGQVVGGKVVGPLVAAGTVYVVAASFNNPTYHRLPIEGEDERGNVVGGGGGGAVGGNDQRQISSSSTGVSGDEVGVAGGGNNAMYAHLGSSDVLWAPAARSHGQHPPPHPPY